MVCPSTNRCRFYGDKHHIMPHLGATESASELQSSLEAEPIATSTVNLNDSGNTKKMATLASNISGGTLLATAVFTVISERGNSLTVCVLLDSAFKASFVSERVAQKLRLLR